MVPSDPEGAPFGGRSGIAASLSDGTVLVHAGGENMVTDRYSKSTFDIQLES